MKPQYYLSVATLVVLGLAGGVAVAKPSAPASAASPAFSGHQLAGQATVSLPGARAAATKARPGLITDEELEKEGGGSGLRYSFDVKSAGALYEVGVDAKTGRILENHREGPNRD
jgi:uncharacterized membrane protein YkoI